MKNSEIKELTDKELKEKLQDEKTLLVRMKLNHSVSPLDNPNELGVSKKTIARINTEIRRRELENKES